MWLYICVWFGEDNGGDILGVKSILDYVFFGCDDDYDDLSECFVLKILKLVFDYFGYSWNSFGILFLIYFMIFLILFY